MSLKSYFNPNLTHYLWGEICLIKPLRKQQPPQQKPSGAGECVELKMFHHNYGFCGERNIRTFGRLNVA